MPQAVGIDLGAHAVKVVDLRVGDKGALIRRALLIDRQAARDRGVDFADRPKLLALVKQEMAAAGIPSRDVALAISGKDSIIRYTHVPPVPAWRLKKIMEYEVGEVAEKIGEKLSSDYRVLPLTREEDDEQSIIIGLAKEPSLEALLDELKAAGITVSKAVPAPLALYAAYSAFGRKPDLENPEDELVVLLDLGAENLNTASLLNGNLAFARSATFGGRNFTEAIARDLGLDPERAELLKLRGGTLEPGGGGRREETVNPLRAAAAQLLSMVQSTLKFSRSQTGAGLPDPTRFVLLGGGMGLPGLVPYLQGGLRRPMELFQPQVSVSPEIGGAAGKVLAASPGSFGMALGLAACALRRGGVELSLLPSRYLERRQFFERTLALYLAAAFLLVFLCASFVQGFGERSRALERRGYLARTKDTLERHRQEMEQNAVENGRAKARINRILTEAELGPFQAFVHDFLARKTGTELKLNSWKLLLDSDEEGEPQYALQIEGAADSASQRALDRIEGLRAALQSESRIERVEVISTRQVGNWYEFQMVLVPSYQAYR